SGGALRDQTETVAVAPVALELALDPGAGFLARIGARVETHHLQARQHRGHEIEVSSSERTERQARRLQEDVILHPSSPNFCAVAWILRQACSTCRSSVRVCPTQSRSVKRSFNSVWVK